MLTAINSTYVTLRCATDGTESSVAISTLIAGTNESKDQIYMTNCATANHSSYLSRTWDNPSLVAGFANSLHRQLVSLGQCHSTWNAELQAENEAVKPQFYYALNSTTRTASLGTNNEVATDLDALRLVVGVTAAKQAVEYGVVYPSGTDSDIQLWINRLYSREAERTKQGNALKKKRVDAGLP